MKEEKDDLRKEKRDNTIQIPLPSVRHIHIVNTSCLFNLNPNTTDEK